MDGHYYGFQWDAYMQMGAWECEQEMGLFISDIINIHCIGLSCVFIKSS